MSQILVAKFASWENYNYSQIQIHLYISVVVEGQRNPNRILKYIIIKLNSHSGGYSDGHLRIGIRLQRK